MNPTDLAVLLEAALLAAGRNLSVAELGELFEEAERPAAEVLREALVLVGERCEGRAYELVETASGFRLQVRREFAVPVSRLWPERPARYSRALLETLALIAYRQPLTRAEIESVRGVAVNPNIIKTLFERNWIRVVGHRELPGRPELLGTTRDFLDYFGLKTLAQLPPLAELKSLEDLNPQLALPEPVGPGEASNEPDLSVAAPEVAASDGVAPEAQAQAGKSQTSEPEPARHPDADAADGAEGEVAGPGASGPEAAEPEAAEPEGDASDSPESVDDAAVSPAPADDTAVTADGEGGDAPAPDEETAGA